MSYIILLDNYSIEVGLEDNHPPDLFFCFCFTFFYLALLTSGGQSGKYCIPLLFYSVCIL